MMERGTLIPVEEYLSTSYRPDREYIDGEYGRQKAAAASLLQTKKNPLARPQ
jgi:hypothetical protein